MTSTSSMAENELATPGSTSLFRASSEEQERYNEEVDLHKDPLKAFYLHGGGVFYNIHELIANLSSMPDEIFSFHVMKEKNDFANWTRDVFKMPSLSERMRYFHNKHSLKQFLKTYFESGIAGGAAMHAQAPAENPQGGAQAKASGDVMEKLEDILFKNRGRTAPEGTGQGAGGITPLTEDEASEILKRVKEHEAHKYGSLCEPGVIDRIDRIRDRILALKKEIAEKRREGADLFFSTLLLKRLEPQIKLALASSEEKDIQKLILYIEEIERTFQEEIEAPVVNIKKEVLTIAQERTRVHDAAMEARAKERAAQDGTQGAPSMSREGESASS